MKWGEGGREHISPKTNRAIETDTKETMNPFNWEDQEPGPTEASEHMENTGESCDEEKSYMRLCRSLTFSKKTSLLTHLEILTLTRALVKEINLKKNVNEVVLAFKQARSFV